MSNKIKETSDYLTSKIRRGTDFALAYIAHQVTKRKVEYYAQELKKESPDEDAYYTQERQGQYGQTFTIKKLRTMRSDPTGTLSPAERLTDLGKEIRRKGIDEYPQFENVMDGDMSFFGYRPRQVNLPESIPHCYSCLLYTSPSPRDRG